MATIAEQLDMVGRQEMVVSNPPDSFLLVMAPLPTPKIDPVLSGVAQTDYLLAFVQSKAEVDLLAAELPARLVGDAQLWLAYSSRSTELGPDTGWQSVTAAGFQAIATVVIDTNWTALRFRRSQYIKAKKPTEA